MVTAVAGCPAACPALMAAGGLHHQAAFAHHVGHRLFHVNILVGMARGHGDGRMPMIRRGNDHRFQDVAAAPASAAFLKRSRRFMGSPLWRTSVLSPLGRGGDPAGCRDASRHGTHECGRHLTTASSDRCRPSGRRAGLRGAPDTPGAPSPRRSQTGSGRAKGGGSTTARRSGGQWSRRHR